MSEQQDNEDFSVEVSLTGIPDNEVSLLQVPIGGSHANMVINVAPVDDGEGMHFDIVLPASIIDDNVIGLAQTFEAVAEALREGVQQP